jgi:hypothetical protein
MPPTFNSESCQQEPCSEPESPLCADFALLSLGNRYPVCITAAPPVLLICTQCFYCLFYWWLSEVGPEVC